MRLAKPNCECEEFGNSFCCNCSKYVCQKCNKKHLKHFLTDTQISHPFIICHNEMIDYYCVDCDKGICTNCSKNEHLKHQCYKYNKYKEIIKEKCNLFRNLSSFIKVKLLYYPQQSLMKNMTTLLSMFIRAFNEYAPNHDNIIKSIIALENIKITNLIIKYKHTIKDIFNNPLIFPELLTIKIEVESLIIPHLVVLPNQRILIVVTCNMTDETFFHIYSSDFSK